MKILITGGAGYIGTHTAIELFEHTNWEVISIDNFSNSSALAFDRVADIAGKKVVNYNIDLRDYEATAKVFEQNKDIVGIIHFAAFKAVGESVEKPLLYYDNNINSLVNILKCQKEFGIPHLIFSSSCSVYGNLKELPVTENSELQKAESPYAYTKQMGEIILQDFIKSNPKLKSIALRYFNPVGAHESGLNGELALTKPNNLVPFITQTAIGKLEQLTVFGGDYSTKDGTCIRDYVHVSDIAHAHVVALQKLVNDSSMPNYDVINLGTGNGVSVLEAIQSFEHVSGVKLNYTIGPRREGDVEAIYANNSKAMDILGWSPKFGVEEMMRSAWKWEQHIKEISA